MERAQTERCKRRITALNNTDRARLKWQPDEGDTFKIGQTLRRVSRHDYTK